MIRELKYLFFLIVICFSLFFTIRYYFSDANFKNAYRSISKFDIKLKKTESELFLLKSNTENIIEFVEFKNNKKKDKYSFWELLSND
tara:strand:- start:3408 stop:3668 length:261 start_codon:yes stop_codon:yes gene_type:complete